MRSKRAKKVDKSSPEKDKTEDLALVDGNKKELVEDTGSPTPQQSVTRRGKTVMHKLTINRAKGIKKKVVLNDLGIPVGVNAKEMQSYIGVQAREQVSIKYKTWKEVPTTVKDNIWEAVNFTFEVDPTWKRGCIISASNKWRQYKNKLTQYVKTNASAPDLHNPPKGESINPTDWSQFVISRLSDEFKKTSEDHSKLRALHKYPHRMSRKGYANFAQENPSLITGDDEIDRATLWSEVRKTKDGSYEDEDLKATLSKITEFVESKKSVGFSKENTLEHALESKRHGGRVIGIGGHVTPSTYYHTGKGKEIGNEVLARQQKLLMEQEFRIRKLEEEIFSFREASCSVRPTKEAELVEDDDDIMVVNEDKFSLKTGRKKQKKDEDVSMPTMDPKTMPRELYQLYIFFKIQASGLVTINLQEEGVFGCNKNLYVHLEDVEPVCQLSSISYNAIAVYMWYLHKTYPRKMVDEIKFVDPYDIGYQPSKALSEDAKIEKRASFLAKRLYKTPAGQICVAPCNVGAHWILTVIDPNREEVCLLDPLFSGIHDALWKQVVDTALRLFMLDAGKKGRKTISWKVIKGPKQPDSFQCGYYVLRYMHDIMQYDGIVSIGMIESIFTGKKYCKEDIDDVRRAWASCIQDEIVV